MRAAENWYFHEHQPCSVENCSQPSTAEIRVPICHHHLLQILQDHGQIQATLAHVLHPPQPTTPRPGPPGQSLARCTTHVYYIRFASHIKIGTTASVTKRMKAMHVHPSALLAVEPGDRTTERQRHAMFTDERYERTELFEPSARLLDHIHHVRSLFGEPASTLR